jgi:hypothetical protein
MDDQSTLSRRAILKGAALFAGAALTAGVGPARQALAQQKASKETMKYQDKPNGDKQCSNCNFFVSPDGCKIVEGTISPQGYCISWQKKG